MLQARSKTGESTIVMKEGDYGWLVTAHKEQLPPHYSEEFANYGDALTQFSELAVDKLTAVRQAIEGNNVGVNPRVDVKLTHATNQGHNETPQFIDVYVCDERSKHYEARMKKIIALLDANLGKSTPRVIHDGTVTLLNAY